MEFMDIDAGRGQGTGYGYGKTWRRLAGVWNKAVGDHFPAHSAGNAFAGRIVD
jgi:hypothetical protein